MNLDELKNRHVGEIGYVIGSGKALEFFEPDFFADKLTFGTNLGWSLFLPSVDYLVTKYHRIANEWKNSDRVGRVLVSRGNRGEPSPILKNDPDLTIFEHEPNKCERFTADDWPDAGLVVSFSTITSTMHFAAHTGVSAIITLGVDSGWIDGQSNIGDYKPSLPNDLGFHFEKQNRIVAKEIRQRYDIPVMSLLPFVTPNMEGHSFESAFGKINVA